MEKYAKQQLFAPAVALQCDETEKWKYGQERQLGLLSARVTIDEFVFRFADGYKGTEQFIEQTEKNIGLVRETQYNA